MGIDYSYTQPSESADFGGDDSDTASNEVEALIHQNQAQLRHDEIVYPPQPDTEFGFPQTCYCGSQPQIATSCNGRRYYTCSNKDDGDCHVWKWWDEAVMEEMSAAERHTLQLAEKVDSLHFLSDYETDQKLVRLENMVSELVKNKPRSRFDVIVVVMLMAYGSGADAVDEYIRMAETTARKCLHHFTAGIIQLFGDQYLRHPTPEDLERLLYIGEQRGFPGMVGSIDCMHWEWKNCPAAWKWMYSRGTGKPSIVLEAVASQDLWIWHAFFGAPGTVNDLNILDRSHVFDEIINGNAPEVNFHVNGREYNLAYYLADGIYPKWATFIQFIRLPQGPKHCCFAKQQEFVRKDIERAFGVLQARFAVVRKPSNLWDKNKIRNIMRACIILHNMIVENERDSYGNAAVFQQGEEEDPTFVVRRTKNLNNTLGRRADVRDTPGHLQLKADLVENIWAKFGHLPL